MGNNNWGFDEIGRICGYWVFFEVLRFVMLVVLLFSNFLVVVIFSVCVVVSVGLIFVGNLMLICFWMVWELLIVVIIIFRVNICRDFFEIGLSWVNVLMGVVYFVFRWESIVCLVVVVSLVLWLLICVSVLVSLLWCELVVWYLMVSVFWVGVGSIIDGLRNLVMVLLWFSWVSLEVVSMMVLRFFLLLFLV